MGKEDISVVVADKDSEFDLLYDYEDDIEKHIVGTRDEWIGWIRIQIRSNPLLKLILAFQGGKLKGYSVVSLGIIPPVSKSVYILYAHSMLGKEGSLFVWGEICEWARGLGAEKIEMKTDTPDFFIKNYSFEKDTYVSLVLRL